MRKRFPFLAIFVVLFLQIVPAQKPAPTATPSPSPTAAATPSKEKPPIIFIPGVLGTRLKNSDTGEGVWVNIKRSKDDDLRLPMSANIAANKDKLVPDNVIEKIKIVKYFPKLSVYQGVSDFLESGGYKAGDWDDPKKNGAAGDHDTYYMFAYDWRRDNVENAARLLQMLDKLRVKLGKPGLKFDVMAHSMGGLIARYAAMYGRTDLTDNPRPTWEGTKYFHDVCLFGTPNEGAMEAFDTMIHGYSFAILGGRRHLGVLNEEVALTSPALFELLPYGDTANFYDEELQPLHIDIYNPETWKTYGWSAAFDPQFRATQNRMQLLQIDKYFVAVLNRARRFHAALAVKSPPPASLFFFTFGSDCKPTLNGAILYKEPDGKQWSTLTRGDSFRDSKGNKISSDDVKKAIFSDGDGTVTKSSLMIEGFYQAGKGSSLIGNAAAPFYACEDHVSLLGNKAIQSSVLEELLKD
jgi:pimeloyl-ACP methyl ester carboxylesterase